MRDVLLIVAAGKSSRFGGFPKAFCEIGKKMNADNTVINARKVFDCVYIGVNHFTYSKYCNAIRGCRMFGIKTGQGDAHSLLKCLRYVREQEKEISRITVCWGDAVFVDEIPFREFLSAANSEVAVACAKDNHPYAWFETNGADDILKAHFAKEEGNIEKGLHDQSLFSFNLDFAVKYLNEYRNYLKIPDDNNDSNAEKNEMKLLFSFEYLIFSGYNPAKCIEITPNKVLSFNTQDELEIIKETLGK